MREIRRGCVIIYEDRPVILPAILAAMTFVFAVSLGSHLSDLLAAVKEPIGMLLGLLLCGAGVVLFFRRDRFVFDQARKRLRWRKWSMIRRDSGEIDVSDIVDVTLESMSGSAGGGSYRVALRTRDGALPLTESYAGDADRCRPTAARRRDIVEQAGQQAANADTDALVDQGRQIDAVRPLRETVGLDLARAKARFDAVRSRAD